MTNSNKKVKDKTQQLVEKIRKERNILSNINVANESASVDKDDKDDKKAVNSLGNNNPLKMPSIFSEYIKQLEKNLPHDDQNILRSIQDFYPILKVLEPLFYAVNLDPVEIKENIKSKEKDINNSSNNIIKVGILNHAKTQFLFSIQSLAEYLNSMLIKPQLTLKELDYFCYAECHEKLPELLISEQIKLKNLTDILEGISRIIPEIQFPQKVFEPRGLVNDLNYMVGGSAITSGCKALRDPKKWTENVLGKAFYQHNKADKSDNYIVHYINDWTNGNEIKLMPYSEAEQILDKYGVYPALFHLILAVQFYRQSDPLSTNFRLKGTDLIKDLGLDKRTDLTKEEKLNRVLEIVTAVSSLVITAKWESIIKVQKGKKSVDKKLGFEVMPSIMWILSTIKITEKDLFGNEKLLDLDIRAKAGAWLGHFFNQSGREIGKALYNFATLSRKILDLDPYHEELALRIALLQSTMDYRQYYTVEQWLIENLLGAREKISKAKTDRKVREYLSNSWDKTLIALERIGFTISYDEKTYPENLRPHSPKKPYKHFDPLLMAKVRLTPETLGKPQSVIDVKAEEIKPVKQIIEKIYSGADLKAKREALGITQPMIAKYLAKNKMYVSRIEKTQILTKEKYKEILDAINYVSKYKSKFE